MNLNSARQFVAVVDHGSFRKAAQATGVPVSTLSDRIAGLERDLGTALFVRTTRRLTITDAGKELYDSCSSAITTMMDAAERVAGHGNSPTGTLRITAPTDFAAAELAEAIQDYRQRHPNVHVETHLTNRYVDLVGERFDIGIRGGNLKSSGLIARRVGSGSLVLVASPTYVSTATQLRHPRELNEHTCIGFLGEGFSRGGAVWQLRSDAGARCNVKPQFALRSTSFAVVIQHAVRGAGMALIPRHLVKEQLGDGTLTRVLPRWATSPIPVHIVVPELRVPSRKTKDMVALLHERLQPLLAE